MFTISETKLNKYTVKISYEGGQKHLGSGFFVSPRLILTCAHVCLKHKDKVFKIYYQGQAIESQINLKYCSDDIEKLDVALLEIENNSLEFPFVLLDKSVEVGHKLYSFGYPDNYAIGDVGTFEYIGIDGDGLFKFKEGNVRPGMSGSSLLNLTTKRVCGMIVFTLDRGKVWGGRGIPTRTILDAEVKELAELKAFQLSCYSRENPFTPPTGQINNIHKVFGRDLEIQRSFELLNSGSGVALIGASGMGKSSLLNVIEAEADNCLKSPRKVIKINLGDIIEDNDFYDELCYQAEIDYDDNHPLRGVRLKRALSQQRLLLLLDGLRRDMVWEGKGLLIQYGINYEV
ncbi:MAG: trypsin-like peptidase domain-containing protein [Microcystaceae cyanobacterium]